MSFPVDVERRAALHQLRNRAINAIPLIQAAFRPGAASALVAELEFMAESGWFGPLELFAHRLDDMVADAAELTALREQRGAA